MEKWKPCYKFDKDLLVLARVARKEDGSWHLCKAHISQGLSGKSTSTTKVSKEFATRVGWLKSEKKKGSSCKPKRGRVVAGENASQPPEQYSCFLAVGGCQTEIIVGITDSPALSASSAQGKMFEWHINIGETDFKALVRNGWDNKICYLDVAPQKGPSSRPPMCPSNCRGIADALSSGHADCMRYWHGEPISSLARTLSESERKALPRRALPLFEPQYPTCSQAARWPSAEVLMYAHDVLGLSWDKFTSYAAAAAGSIDCLSFAHCSGCPWDNSVCIGAASAGSMACLRYAHEQGCEWNWQTCAAAASHGHRECLQYARKHGCEWNAITCSGAAGKGNVEILAYAFESGCPWNTATCFEAAYAGSMECLVYAHERGCPWDAHTCKRAAFGRRLECLRYAHEQGCSWDEETLYAAAEIGSLECLMYAHEHGCPYNDAAAAQCDKPGLTSVAMHGEMSLPCLQYMCESMGCGWDSSGFDWKFAFWMGRCDLLEYIHLHGGAWCKEDELLEWDEEHHRGDDLRVEGIARCLLYMHWYGGCKLPTLKGTKAGELVLALLQERRAAVLLSFRAAGRAEAGSPSADAVDAAHAVMAMVPADLIWHIISAAKLLIAD